MVKEGGKELGTRVHVGRLLLTKPAAASVTSFSFGFSFPPSSFSSSFTHIRSKFLNLFSSLNPSSLLLILGYVIQPTFILSITFIFLLDNVYVCDYELSLDGSLKHDQGRS